ncbi:hypothetical protein H0H87_006937 [Tephrocybe sp. NHM501043]|nr:hypothetical protein H0H87_006937 [Tephrocybe sp. NHM501043]
MMYLITSLLKPMEDHTAEALAEEDVARLPVKIAIYASLFSNFGLCVLQLYAAISSGSLSLLATGIDSVFDIGSNVLLFWLHRKAEKMDVNRWPVGGARLETIGNIIYGVIVAWGRTIYGEFELLAGKSAPHDFLQLLIYKAATFSEEIVKVDTVRAYHSGPDYFVEVDVVMDADTPLWKAHDLSQQLQDKIEVLPNVERAFVHVDHETTHTPEHRKLILT